MAGIYNLLKNIKKRPKMYLGKISITRLHMLLIGYNIGINESGLDKEKEEFKFQDFQQWIQKKYSIISSKSWATIILDDSKDEEDALYKFFALLEEFEKEIV